MLITPRLKSVLGLTLLAFTLGVRPTLAADEARGTFRFGKTRLQPVDALAYQEDEKDPAKPVTVVVLTDSPIDRPAVMEAIDPLNAVGYTVGHQEGER